jgi:uncharacterized membrane protein
MFTTGGFSDPANLLRVDILNCIGLAMATVSLAALAWRAILARLIAALALAASFTLLAPIVWHAPLVVSLPAPLRGYFAGGPSLGLFPLFPWAGFVAFGLASGLVLTSASGPVREGPRIGLLALAEVGLVGLGFGLDRLPPVYEHTDFWRTSPSYFWIRCGLLLLVVALAWLWQRAPWKTWPSPLRQMGRTSLLIY